MKEILAIVRMNKMNQTKRALSEVGISSITARDALGRGKGLVDVQLLKGAEKGYEEGHLPTRAKRTVDPQTNPAGGGARRTGG